MKDLAWSSSKNHHLHINVIVNWVENRSLIYIKTIFFSTLQWGLRLKFNNNDIMSMVWQVGMTTGATIHTTAGLNMTVTRRSTIPSAASGEPILSTVYWGNITWQHEDKIGIHRKSLFKPIQGLIICLGFAWFMVVIENKLKECCI